MMKYCGSKRQTCRVVASVATILLFTFRNLMTSSPLPQSSMLSILDFQDNTTSANITTKQDSMNAMDSYEITMSILDNNNHRTVSDPRLPKVPKVPLSNYSLEVVQKARPVNLTYVKRKNTLQARDEHKQSGYTSFDVTRLGKSSNPPPLDWNASELQQACSQRDAHWDALQRIQVNRNNSNDSPPGQKRVKLLCAVYSCEQYHHKISALRETWAPKCDGFFVASNKTDPSIDAIDIPHSGPEAYGNMWAKVRSIWFFMYDHFYNDYDWFHLGGDDMWVIVENLRLYLESEEILTAANGGIYLPNDDYEHEAKIPLYLGSTFALAGNKKNLYQTGGPGYTLNKAALKLLVLEGLPNYFVSLRKAAEDKFVAQTFRKLGVRPYRTMDVHRSERYNHFPPGRHYTGSEPAFFHKYTHPFKYKRGKEHSSVHSVSFHYVEPTDMRRFHAILYGICGHNSSDSTS